ncbi:PAS domain-containing sensor histidine kinase [Phormidium sp. CCY1219]|uniref:PAS domain-containing sensor histidine kinase n=1 Tax=Phormidium sp. CCY1219 TaxID=2886104 RepID=UPI002D1F0DE8|nr:PAS domain S-box protein [Phormidium sp. CCY1219]MEB3828980.1 PAS domain S-box protein [Phormidium sp. CCY1219]
MVPQQPMNNSANFGEISAEIPRTESGLHAFFELSLDLFCLGTPTGYFQHLNPAWERVLGWRREELMSRPWREFVHPADREPSDRAQARCHETDIYQFENRYRHKNGTYRTISWNISRIQNGKYYAVGRDITEQKQVREALEKQVAVSQSLQEILDSIGDGIAVIDKQGKAVYLNQAGLQIHRKETAGQAFENWTQEFEVYRTDRKTRLSVAELPVVRALKGDRLCQIQVYLRYRDTDEGVYLNVSASPIVKQGEVDGAVVIFRNINHQIETEQALQHANAELERRVEERTAQLRQSNQRLKREIVYRKLAHHALRESEARFRSVVESNTIGIVFWELNGKITDANDAFLQAIGYGREALLAGELDWEKITPRKYRKRDRESISQILYTRSFNPFEKELIRKDGSCLPIVIGGALIANSDDRGVSFVVDISDRFQAEAALRDSEQRYRQLFESHPLPMWVYDVETLAFLAVNDAAIHAYGYSREEFLSMTIVDIRPCEYREELLQQVAHCRHMHYFRSGIWRHCKKDGTIIDVEITSNAIAFDGKSARVVLANDITEQLRSQEELRLSEQRFRLAVDNIPDTFVIYDPQRRLEFVNATGIERSGLSLEELRGNRDEEIFPPTVTNAYLPMLKKAVETRRMQQGEFTVTLPTIGNHTILVTYVPLLDERGEIYQILGITHDISDRQRMEAKIREMNQQLEVEVERRTAELETFLNALPDYIFVVEIDSMRMPFCNQVFARGIGFENRQQVQGKTIFECFPAEHAQRFLQQNQRVFATGETFHAEETIELPDRVYHFDTFKVPLTDKNGEIYGLIGTSRDITELVETKKALGERTAELEAVNQELDSFSYSVSHDLRAPLRQINGLVSALRQQLESEGAIADEKVARYLEFIEGSSQKMTQLIEGLLTLCRLGRKELQTRPVELRDVVGMAIDTVMSQQDSDNLAVEFEVGELPRVMGDATLLQQVFGNLIDNAVKFSRDRRPPRVTVGFVPENIVFVKDNGVGFSMKHADKLFAVFQRLHSQTEFEGTGIGLAIVQRIIHRHGGKIWGQSEPNQGTTFFFTLKIITPN